MSRPGQARVLVLCACGLILTSCDPSDGGIKPPTDAAAQPADSGGVADAAASDAAQAIDRSGAPDAATPDVHLEDVALSDTQSGDTAQDVDAMVEDAWVNPDFDGDGVLDVDDACALGASEWTSASSTDHDGDGCRDVDEDLDDDGDGISDTADACPLGTDQWVSDQASDHDGDGCRDVDEDADDDDDGVADANDSCPRGALGWTSDGATDRDGDGCRDVDEDSDDDDDGVADADDSCPRGALGWTSDGATDHDGDGCRDLGEDADDDDDGVADANDSCATGALGWTADGTTDHDGDGCRDADEDLDDDGDGVADNHDACALGATGWGSVGNTDHDGDGCQDSGEDLDDDDDGVADGADLCARGATGWTSGPSTDNDGDGCQDSGEDADDDNDSAPDGVDCAPLDPTRQVLVDGTCVADADDDSDGTLNAVDCAPADPNLQIWLDDGTTCVADDTDDDDDSVLDVDDVCARGATGWVADSGTDHDGDGCRDADEDGDDDGDGTADGDDRCPRGEVGWLADPVTDRDDDGCRDAGEDLDDDGDGVADASDGCPAGVLGWTSGSGTDHDGDGCRDLDEDEDDDGDGVTDQHDACALGATEWSAEPGTDHDGDGCQDSGEDLDDDDDGVADLVDACATGAVLWGSSPVTDHDGDGCQDSGEDLDDDDDGVPDAGDACALGALGWTSSAGTDHDADGCRDSDEDGDDDGDGVLDGADACAVGDLGWTSDPGTDFDGDGCQDSGEDPDDDNDGVLDGDDCAPRQAQLRVLLDDGITCFDPDAVPQDIDLGMAWDEQRGGAGLLAGQARIINGNMVLRRMDLSFPSPHRTGLGLRVSYNSRATTAGSLGHGWRHSYEVTLESQLVPGDLTVLRITDESGRALYFVEDVGGGTYHGVFFERSRVVDEDGGWTWQRLDGNTYHFEVTGQLSWIDDVADNRQWVTYDAGHIDTVRDNASGRFLAFFYGTDGLLDLVQGPGTAAVSDNVWVHYDHDTAGNLIQVTYADGSGEDYSYADADPCNLTEVSSRAGHVVESFSYDSSDRLLGIDRPSNDHDLGIVYQSPDVVQVTDAYAVARSYALASIGLRRRVVAMTGASRPPYGGGHVRWVYDAAMNLTELEDFSGRVDQYSGHDSRGLPGSMVLGAGSGLVRNVDLTWHPHQAQLLQQREASVLGGGDKVTTWDYDLDAGGTPNEAPTGLLRARIEQGLTQDLSGQTQAFTYTTSYIYNTAGQLASVDGPLAGTADTVSYSYSAAGDLETITYPIVGSVSFAGQDGAGDPAQAIDLNGKVTSFTYDGRRRVTQVSFGADGSSQTFSYDSAGRLSGVTDEDGVSLSREYDPVSGLLTRVLNGAGEYRRLMRDGHGRIIEVGLFDAGDVQTYRMRYGYTHGSFPGQLHHLIHPDDTYVAYDYDTAGRPSSVTDARGHTTNTAYDVLGQVSSVTRPGGLVTSYGHDRHGNLASVTDANGLRTDYTYDDLGRLLAVVSPDTGTSRRTYDAANNLVLEQDATGAQIAHTYDALSRKLTVEPDDSSQDVSFVYDSGTNGAGKVASLSDASGSTTFGYDSRGRTTELVSVVSGVTTTVSSSFTPGGRLQGLVYPSGRTLTYGYDTEGRLQSAVSNYNSVDTTLLSSQVYLPFGPAVTVIDGQGNTSNSVFDQAYRLQSMNAGQPAERQYGYDADGNLTTITAPSEPWWNQIYSYDGLDRLTQETGAQGLTSYIYDALGRRQSVDRQGAVETYTYQAGSNHLSELSGSTVTSLSYDAAGRVTKLGARTLDYNAWGQVALVTGGAEPDVSYVHNALRQQVQRQEFGVSPTSAHFDAGGLLAAERENGVLVREYLYVNGGLTAIHDVASGELLFVTGDSRGAPQLVTNAANEVEWEAAVDGYGQAEVHPSSTLTLEVRLPGQRQDPVTGLRDNHFRTYWPEAGIYLQPDPARIYDVNLYSYAGGNPVMGMDPMGLQPLSSAMGAIGGGIAKAASGGWNAVTSNQEMHRAIGFVAEAVGLVTAYVAERVAVDVWNATGSKMLGVPPGWESCVDDAVRVVLEGDYESTPEGQEQFAKKAAYDAVAGALQQLIGDKKLAGMDTNDIVELTKLIKNRMEKFDDVDMMAREQDWIEGYMKKILGPNLQRLFDDLHRLQEEKGVGLPPKPDPDYPESWDVTWDANNPTQADPGSSVTLSIKAGHRPFTWSVSGVTASFARASTGERSNTLDIDASAEGTALITVTDAHGTEASGALNVLLCDCGEPPAASIGAATTALALGGQYEFTIEGASWSDCYSWGVEGGGVILSVNGSGTMTYLTPASNPNCELKPVISLSCAGAVVDTEPVFPTNYLSPSTTAYGYVDATGCYWAWPGQDRCCWYPYTCGGAYFGWTRCEWYSSSACDDVIGCGEPGALVDHRDQAMKDAGCCPPALQ
ncbi:MAG: RHS repeat-associated core domain-containing protein [Pseudomonadota bacterium]